MLFRARTSSATRGGQSADSSSLLARLIGCALPAAPRRRAPRTLGALAFQTLEPRLVMHSSLDVDGSHDDEDLQHPNDCCCGCCGGHLHGLDPIESTETGGNELGGGETLPLASLPLLSSNPDATVKLYLDFDGHYEAQWGSYSNITTPAFSIDGDFNTFNTAEIDAITEIWKRVSEDFAPFNIDVTTINPNNFDNKVGLRVAIGGSSSWYGSTVGGLGYINSFTDSVVNTVYVFPNHLAKTARYIAEASSHEAGHAFGLRHQSTYVDGSKTEEYNSGNGDWAPIMGSSYYKTRTTWHNGNSYSSTAFQDDMAIISRTANGFGYRTDDHGDFNSATTLNFVADTATAAGIVEQMTDEDAFAFTATAGLLELEVNVAEVGANLDAVIELWTAGGQLVATADPSGSYGATISTNVAAGDYVLVVRSTGEYGSVGQYTVSASRAATVTEVAISGPSSAAQDHVYTLELDEVSSGASPITSWTIDWGDGTVEVINGNPSTATHVYTNAPGPYTIQASATDGEDTFAADSIVVNVFDPAPVLSISGNNSVTEGGEYVLSLSAGGAGAAYITSWTINWGDGTVQVISGNPDSVTHEYADGDANVTIHATATNPYGTYAADDIAVNVTDVDAVVAVSGSESIEGGTTYVLNLSATDPGDDTITHWTINWGDGTIEQVNGNPSTATHEYANVNGQYTITASATDEDGTYQANSLVVDVVKVTVPMVNFNNHTIESYGQTQDRDGEVSIEDSGRTLRLTGNLWKSIELPYTITADTVLEFDFSSSHQGEVHAIGLGTSSSAEQTRSFMLYGTQEWGRTDFRNYAENAPGTVHYRIRIGEFYTGAALRLFFVNDDDSSAADGESVYSNLRVYEALAANGDEFTIDEGNSSTVFNVLDNDTSTTGIDHSELTIAGVSAGSQGGTVTIAGNGRSLIYTPASGFAGTETFNYTIVDGTTGNESSATLTVHVEAVTSITGSETASTEGDYVLSLSSRNGVDVTKWTINWGDGNIEVINGNPSTVSHQYENSGVEYTIVATAADGGYSYHANSKTIKVPSQYLDFSSVNVGSYSYNQDGVGFAAPTGGGQELTLLGNVWKRIDFPYNITADTVLEFDFRSDKLAEVHAIGFDTTLSHDASRAFQLGGTQKWGIQDFKSYRAGDGTVRFVIPIGQYYTGEALYMFFVNDDDTASPNSQSKFSNLRIYEVMSAHNDVFETYEGSQSVELDVLANDSSATGVPTPLTVYSVSAGSAGGTMVVAGDGRSVIYTPANGFVGTETFTYAVVDGTQDGIDWGKITVRVAPAVEISGSNSATDGVSYKLNLSSHPDVAITGWTIDWGDGTTQHINGDPSVASHVYSESGGKFTITATAENGGSEYAPQTHDVYVSVTEIDFNDKPVRSYAGKQDGQGSIKIKEDGAALRLKGNQWKRVSLPFTITANTVLEFDFRSPRIAEVHGIGFDNDWYHSSERTFQIGGTQTFGLQDFRTYATGDDELVHFEIPVGQFYTGYVKYLFFVNDDDTSNPNAIGVFSNIKIYERSPDSAPAAAPTGNWTAPGLDESQPFQTAQTDDLDALFGEIDEQLALARVTSETAAGSDNPVGDVAAAESWNATDSVPYVVSAGRQAPAGIANFRDWLTVGGLNAPLTQRDLFFALYDGSLD